MQIREYAEQLLFGATLADKLLTATDLRDDVAGAAVPAPTSPGRPESLMLQRSKSAIRFPSEPELRHAEARGRLLHFFANHELLAIELMALALLRFPDAEPAFRRGLLGIIGEEQKHLSSYLTAMGRGGVVLGSLPVSAFFWDTLSRVETPLAFVSGLSLTFEQANLDFASHYAAVMRQVGDVETAEVLQTVLADEIGHVRHGLLWFDRWRDPTQSPWQSWVAALPPPLVPSRARGLGFCRAAREAAGMDAAMIDAVEVAGGSKGRPPVVRSFNPEVEAEVAGEPATKVGRMVAEDLGSLPIFLSGPDDVVLVSRRPSTAFLAELRRAGFVVPELVIAPDLAGHPLSGRLLSGAEPWGWSPASAARLSPLPVPSGWRPDRAILHDKGWAAARLAERPDLCDPAVVGVVCDSLVAVQAALDAAGPRPMVGKSPLSTAGRGNTMLQGDFGKKLNAVLAAHGAVLVEPWLDRVLDLSAQFTVGEDGAAHFDGWGRFLTDGRGRYLGAVLGRRKEGCEAALLRFLNDDGRQPEWIAGALDAVIQQLGPAMAARGFSGPAGIDALVYRDEAGFHLKPLVELNPRNTMGRVALALERRVARGRVGLWLQLTVASLKAAGFAGGADFAMALKAAMPLSVAHSPPLIDAGALFTTDPEGAKLMLSVLLVGKNASTILDGLRGLGCVEMAGAIQEALSPRERGAA